MAKLLFPMKCTGYLDISMSYGHPYPTDAKLTKVDFHFLKKVVEIIKKYENNTTALQRIGIQTLSTHEERSLLLEYIYNSDDSFFYSDRLELRKALLLSFISFHPGLDINTAPANNDIGAPVYAIYDGEIVSASSSWCGNKANCGGKIVLMHKVDNQIFYSLYGHINLAPIKKRTVKRGEQIATLAPLSNTTAHLHFEISIKNIYSSGKLYPGYPYKQKALNFAYLASYHYQTLLNHISNKTIPHRLCTPNAIYFQMIVDPKNPFPKIKQTDSLISSFNEFTKSYGLVDPIEFMYKISCNKLYNPPDGIEKNISCSAAIAKNHKSEVCLYF